MALRLLLTLPLPPGVNNQYVTVNGRRVLSPEARRYKQGALRLLRRKRDSGEISQELKLPKISLQAMKDDLDLQAVLAPLLLELQSLTQRIEDTIVEAQAECWWATTAYYTALHRMSAADPELAESLKPAAEFFATGKRRGAPLPPKAPAT